jgi:sulfide:quinone oxidoreductase
MSTASAPVLVAGGGVAALEATLALRDLTDGAARVEVLAPEREFVYRPLVFGPPFGVGEARRFPLDRLLADAGGTLRQGTLAALDPDRHVAVTAGGEEIPYRACLLALGGRPAAGIPGALTFSGPADEEALRNLLADARAGQVGSVAVAVPAGLGWTLPAYELALLTAAHLSDAGVAVEVELVTPEPAPLALFGTRASEAIRELLEVREITLRTGTTPVAFADGTLTVAPAGTVDVDRVVALPTLTGPAIAGVPSNAGGFVPTDRHGAVAGLEDVYAAGDTTAFPVKQGGIAAQQADAAAEAIAAALGAAIDPEPFTPVLRGLLLTGLAPRYLRGESGGRVSTVDTEPLWWPPAKIVGRHLAPFLAGHLGLATPAGDQFAAALPVEVELDPVHAGEWMPV